MQAATTPEARQQANLEKREQLRRQNEERREAIKEQRVQARRKACEPMKVWLEDGPIPTSSGTDRVLTSGTEPDLAVVTLLSNGRFERAFGRPYETLSVQEIQALSRLAATCFGMPEGPLADMSLVQKMATNAALNGYRQSIYLKALERADAARNSLAKLSKEVDALKPTETDYARLGDIQRLGQSALSLAPPVDIAQFAARLAVADKKIALPVQQALTRQTIADAKGLEGFLKLDALSKNFLARPLIPDSIDPQAEAARAANARALAARMDEIALEIAAMERQRIDALGNGLTGLERGVQWRAGYNTRLAPLAQRVKPFNELSDYFLERRQGLLQGSDNALIRVLQNARDEPALQKLKAQYLLPEDAITVPGTKILTAVAEQSREIEKRTAIGPSLQEDRKQLANTAASSVGTAATGVRADANSNTPSGEPSQEVMYDLLRTVLDQGARKQAEFLSQCRSNGVQGSDPAMNYLCAVVMIGKGIQTGSIEADKPAKILKFEKLGCAPAVGQAGYMCDYELAVEKSLNPALVGPQAKRLLEGSSLKQARFLQSRDGWRIFYTDDAVQ